MNAVSSTPESHLLSFSFTAYTFVRDNYKSYFSIHANFGSIGSFKILDLENRFVFMLFHGFYTLNYVYNRIAFLLQFFYCCFVMNCMNVAFAVFDFISSTFYHPLFD